jgi:hypothetical protein
MNDSTKMTRAIRANTVGGAALLMIAAVEIVLVLAGAVSWEAGMALPLGSAAVSGVFALLIAWTLRKDRDDPDGIERREQRLEAGVVVWGGLLVVVALVLVVAIILWGLLR